MAEKLMVEIEPPPTRQSRVEPGRPAPLTQPPRQLRKGIRIRRIRLRNGVQPPRMPRLNTLGRRRYQAPNVGLESRRMYRGLVGIRFRDIGRRIMRVITFGTR